MSKTKKYRLVTGKHRVMENGVARIAQPGEIVELTESQAKAFGNKVEEATRRVPIEGDGADAEKAEAAPTAPEKGQASQGQASQGSK